MDRKWSSHFSAFPISLWVMQEQLPRQSILGEVVIVVNSVRPGRQRFGLAGDTKSPSSWPADFTASDAEDHGLDRIVSKRPVNFTNCLQVYKSRRFFGLVNIGITTYCVFSSEYVLLNYGRGDGLAIFDLIIYEHFRPSCRPAYHFVQSSSPFEERE